MTIRRLAEDDFERAVSRGFWRKVLSRLTGGENDLLPFDEVRQHLELRGQHYLGFRQVDINLVVGSLGRYHDFDRAFLPRQRRTKDRWISIDKAHYEQTPLPPVELIKIGDIYFVKDGNHRISVARERGQVFVDAYVTEIDTPVRLTAKTTVDELVLQQAQIDFYEKTHLDVLRPGKQVHASRPGVFRQLLHHIDVHRWYLGEKLGAEAPYQEAVLSWFDEIYQPLAEIVRENAVLREFPGLQEADLCLWLMEYQAYLRQAEQRTEEGIQPSAAAAQQLAADYPLPAVKKLVEVLNRTHWLDEIILAQQKAQFLEKSALLQFRPEARVSVSLPGQYERLLEHIATHQWYLGEQRKAETSYSEAVGSWFDHVYMPVVETIRQQNILKRFPGRTETDLYLWIIAHQWRLRETYGENVPMQEAAEDFTQEHSDKALNKIVKAVKKITGME